MRQYAFYFNSDKCVGCKTCIIACKDKKNIKPGRKFRRVFSCTGGGWQKTGADSYEPVDIFAYAVSMSCNHCQTPACMVNCPAGAIGKRVDGIVYIDQELCIGCRNCLKACPYDVPSFDPEAEKVDKCDFCRDAVDMGEKPVCIMACPMRALDCGEYEEILALHPENDLTVYPLPSPHETLPSLVITPNRLADNARAASVNLEEDTYASYGYKE